MYNDIKAHEDRHVRDNSKLSTKWNRNYKDQKISACGGSESLAMDNLRAAMNSIGDKAQEALKNEFKKAGDRFHRTRKGKPATTPSCQVCR
jgi:hypothetical protein